MPVDPPVPRPAGWWIGAAGIVLVMAFTAIETILRAGRPNGYKGRHWQGPWPYPTDDVATWLSIMALEGLVICLVLRSRMTGSLTGRSLVLAIGMFVILIALAPLGMHAGAPMMAHFAWLTLATGWLLVFAITAGITRFVRSRLARRAGSAR